jgi:3-phenylpropionate/trans-cinnamate dioxygenase ferredoxin reductase subunit
VAAQWHPKFHAYIRSEHWANAQEQGRIAAISMLASKPEMIREIPWLWTDQFGSNIQMAGGLQPDEWIARGDNTAVTFTLFGIDNDGTVTGAVTVNWGRDMRPARMMIAAHAAPSREALASSATDLGRPSKQFA